MGSVKRYELPETPRQEQACMTDKLSSIPFYEEIVSIIKCFP